MDDLIAFLAARLDEDEAAAKAAAEAACADDWMPSGRVTDAAYRAFREHIARHDPARALREVWAKRKIIEVYEAAASNDPATDHSIGMATLRMVLRSYATIWSGHPDYRQEWAP